MSRRECSSPRVARSVLTSLPGIRRALIVLIAIAVAVPSASALAAGACSRTAMLGFQACKNEVRDDYWTTLGICINLSNASERADCRRSALEEWDAAREECIEIRGARREVCDLLAEDRYDPDVDPADFTDAFENLNPFFPLAPGNHWEFVGGDETINVDVTESTRSIEGVTAIVVKDIVTVDGNVLEDTDDWYGQLLNGDVWYLGEIARNFELPETADDEAAEEPGGETPTSDLVDLEGSWKAGRDGDKSGLLIPALPIPGQAYRQEWKFGDAEDIAVVRSNDYGFGSDPELDAMVPQELVELLCDGDCLVTEEFSPLEPGVVAYKVYSPGIGVFLEVEPATGDNVQLVACNVDPRCDDLPQP